MQKSKRWTGWGRIGRQTDSQAKGRQKSTKVDRADRQKTGE